MEEDLALADPFLDLDQSELHPRSQLDQPDRALLAAHALSAVTAANIVGCEADFAPLLVEFRVAPAGHGPAAASRGTLGV